LNAWFGRFLGVLDEAGVEPPSAEEVRLILEVAGAAARSSGARQFAPAATYLAGIAAAPGDAAERLEVLRRAVEAATAAGPAAEPLEVD
jgi:hypothetical protein